MGLSYDEIRPFLFSEFIKERYPIWVTAKGEEISIVLMDDSYLENLQALLLRRKMEYDTNKLINRQKNFWETKFYMINPIAQELNERDKRKLNKKNKNE